MTQRDDSDSPRFGDELDGALELAGGPPPPLIDVGLVLHLTLEEAAVLAGLDMWTFGFELGRRFEREPD